MHHVVRRRVVAVAAAVAVGMLLAALAGVTVEAAAHRSPLAIMAVVSLAAYALFLVFTWRRADGIAQALVGLAAFGGVLACDNAHFGTLAASGGVSLLGVDADRLAAILLLVLSLVAVTGLVPMRPVPVALKIVVAGFFAYACAPIAFALAQQSGVSTALTTNAPLPPNPIWSRGAFLAALALLPLSTTCALVLAVVAFARRRSVTGQRALAAALAFALATQLTGLETAHAGLPALAVGAATAAVAAIPAQNVAPLPPASAALASHVATAAARFGSDPAALLSRVSNDVAYEIYPGVYRGAAATLADRAGNDYDKALLLHDLMHAANASTPLRFASCTLNSQQADALVAASERAYRVPVLAAQKPRANVPVFKNAKLAEAYRSAPAVWQAISAQARREQAALRTAIASANVSLAPPMASASPLGAIAAHHVWLQAQQTGIGSISIRRRRPRSQVRRCARHGRRSTSFRTPTTIRSRQSLVSNGERTEH